MPRNPLAFVWYVVVGHCLVAAILLKLYSTPLSVGAYDSLMDLTMFEATQTGAASGATENTQPAEKLVITPRAVTQHQHAPANHQSTVETDESSDSGPYNVRSDGAINTGDSNHSSGSPDRTLTEILTRLQRARVYPPAARHQQLTGRPMVEFRIQPNGTIAYVTVLRSSGVAVLDQAALQTVQRAAPFPYYPESIRVPIQFELK